MAAVINIVPVNPGVIPGIFVIVFSVTVANTGIKSTYKEERVCFVLI